MNANQLFTLTELARKLGRDVRGLKKIAQPVAKIMLCGHEVGLYQLGQFKEGKL